MGGYPHSPNTLIRLDCYANVPCSDPYAAMLKLNHALGFKPYMAGSIWQVETKQVAAYLEQQNRK